MYRIVAAMQLCTSSLLNSTDPIIS